MSPTAAMNVAAVCTLTPGTVISRRISGQASACVGDLARRARRSRCRGSRSGAGSRRGSAARRRGSCSPASHAPARLAEAVGDRRAPAEVARQHAHAPRSSRVCGHGRCRSRRAHSRRSARVRSSGAHTVSSNPDAAASPASARPSRSVFAFALADLRQLARVGDHHPRRRAARAIDTISPAPLVASSATTSSAPGSARTAPAPRSPRRRSGPPSGPRRPLGDRDLAEVAMHVQPDEPHTPLLPRRRAGSAAGQATKTDSCSQHTRASRRGGHEQRRARSPSVTNGLPIRVSQQQPLSRDTDAPGRRPDAVSSPDNGSAYRSAVHALACRALGIRHLRTRPTGHSTNGKAERFIRTLLGGWAYGAIYRDSDAAAQPRSPRWLRLLQSTPTTPLPLSHQPPLQRLETLTRNNLLGTYNERDCERVSA